jgi:hypothetical protein
MIHRIRLYYSTDGVKPDQPDKGFHTELQDWKADLDGDTADAVDNNIPSEPTSPMNSDIEYYSVSMTFASHEDPLVVLEDPYGKLVEHCECTWKAENIPADNGTVPDPVPTFT